MMTQTEKLAARLQQILDTPGLHEITVYVAPDKTVQFWVVKDYKPEGEPPPSPPVKTVL